MVKKNNPGQVPLIAAFLKKGFAWTNYPSKNIYFLQLT